MESVEKNKNGDSVPRKIDVNFSQAEKEFNAPEKTLEDIIDEELAFDGSEQEPVIEDKVDGFKRTPVDFEPTEPVFEANIAENTQDLRLELDLNEEEGEKSENPSDTGAKILTMEEDFSAKEKPLKAGKTAKKKGGKGLIGFLVGVIFATVILFGLFYCMYAQIIPNDFFPGKVTEPEKPEEPVSQKVDSELNLAFLKMNNNGQNMIYSPLSIKYALSMLSEGASGNTKMEIDNVLGDLNLTKYENTPEILSLANSMFVRDGFSVKEEFKTSVAGNYNAEILNDPFIDATNINNWISNKTFNLIQNAVPNDAITPETMMTLVNALAIQMDWEQGFEDENTHGDVFTKGDGSVVSATTMSGTYSGDDLRYYVGDDVTVVAKDLKQYGETQLEFAVVMPTGSLNEYVTELDDAKIDGLLEKVTPASAAEAGVELSVPKFKFDYELSSFQDNLIDLGIKDAFDHNLADFSGMAETELGRLYVSKALHKANIDFSEDGIKAAAVTVAGASITSEPGMKELPIEIRIDKPFFFEIRDKANGEVWFSGVVYEPNLWENDQAAYWGQ